MSNGSSRGAARALTLFEAFANSATPLSLSDLARLTDVPVSSCHGLVKTLQARGYLYSLGRSRRIYPTKRLAWVAEAIASKDPIVEAFSPALATLRDATGETAILGVRQDHAVVYLEVLEGTNVIRYSAIAGDLKPLHSSAIGKLILGELPEDDLRRLVSDRVLKKITENTITDPDQLIGELRASRADGFYITRGENVAEVMAISVPVRMSGETFGIAVAGPIERMRRNFDRTREALFDASAKIDRLFAV